MFFFLHFDLSHTRENIPFCWVKYAKTPLTLISREAHHAAHMDMHAPRVLTGARHAWPAFRWGWTFWERRYGDTSVMSKQRAPIFDSDLCKETLIAESSLREYLHYARSAHLATSPVPRSFHSLTASAWCFVITVGARDNTRRAAAQSAEPRAGFARPPGLSPAAPRGSE